VQTEFNEKLDYIHNATKYFLKQIGNKEVNIYKEVTLEKTDKQSKDMMKRTSNSIASCIDTLSFIEDRSSASLKNEINEAKLLLNKILDNIKLNDSKNKIHESDFILHSKRDFTYEKKDIIKLSYYALIEHYHDYNYYSQNYKKQALQEIYNKYGFKISESDKLLVSLTLISSKDGKYLLSPTIPENKLKFPTFGSTI
jgi:hypothetical protein